VQTGELDGIAWSGITEDYTVGWADVTDYFLTNNISGAWIGSFFANRSVERAAGSSQGAAQLCMEAPTTTASGGTGAAKRTCASTATRWS
jgi:hypothetical protein